MESTTPNLPKSLEFERGRAFLGRIADGVSEPPWSRRSAALAVVVSFAGFIGSPEALKAVSRHGLGDVSVFCPTLVWAIPMLCCLGYLTRQAGTTVGKVFGLRGARVGPVLVSSLLLFILGFLLMAGSKVLLTRLGFQAGPSAREEARTIASSLFIATDATVWAPLCEELWFRALLYTSLRTRFGVAPSAVVTATLFAAVHYPQSIVSAGGFFFPAVLSSLWYERTRSLWPNVISHSLHNALPLIILHAGG